jgi:hypothetical protein
MTRHRRTQTRNPVAAIPESDTRESLKKIINYCDAKWLESHQPPAAKPQPPDMLTGKKMAYNDVLQYVRTLIDGLP